MVRDALAVLALAASAAPALAEGPPLILRGSGFTPPAPAVDTERPREVRLSAGDVLWIVDDTGQVTACRLRSTVQVGGSRIECRSRSLD